MCVIGTNINFLVPQSCWNISLKYATCVKCYCKYVNSAHQNVAASIMYVNYMPISVYGSSFDGYK